MLAALLLASACDSQGGTEDSAAGPPAQTQAVSGTPDPGAAAKADSDAPKESPPAEKADAPKESPPAEGAAAPKESPPIEGTAPAGPSGATETVEILPGRDYTEASSPKRLFKDPKEDVELVYIFWFGCGSCRNLDPVMTQYESTLGSGVKFRRIPALYAPNPYWMIHGRLYFTLEFMGKEKELHQAVFEAVQGTGQSDHSQGGLESLGAILNFVEGQGINRKDFMTAWDSPEVAAEMDRALAFIDNLNVNSVPSMAVNGRYSFSLSRRGPSFFLATAEYLVNREKAARDE
jgi:thiol:disulfide interchange protein DsbA